LVGTIFCLALFTLLQGRRAFIDAWHGYHIDSVELGRVTAEATMIHYPGQK
jgi:hypothetical protein